MDRTRDMADQWGGCNSCRESTIVALRLMNLVNILHGENERKVKDSKRDVCVSMTTKLTMLV